MELWVRRVGLIVAVWLLAGGTGWAGEVKIYTDREIRPALLEFLFRRRRRLRLDET